VSDIGTVVWKEWREQFLRRGMPSKAMWGSLFFVAIVGVGYPVFVAFVIGGNVRGLHANLDDTTYVNLVAFGGVMAMAFQGAIVTIGIIVDSFAGERERHTLETLLAGPLPDRAILAGKILAAVLFILATTTALGLFQFAAVLVLWGAAGLAYAGALVAGPILGGLMGFLIACVGAIVSMRAATVKSAAQILSLILLPVFMAPSLLNLALQLTPPGRAVVAFYEAVGPAIFTLLAAGILAVLGGGLFVLASRLFRRDRLILRA